MNKKSVVEIGGASFSNPPSFMSLVEPTRRDAEYETEAVLDEYMRNPNTPPFVADFFIKRFTTSNPSPRYVEAVATAFVTGSYEGLGSNKYGDLEATIAAVRARANQTEREHHPRFPAEHTSSLRERCRRRTRLRCPFSPRFLTVALA